MKFSLPFAFITLLLLSCSTTESVQEPDENDLAEVEQSLVPGWYKSGISSSSDSTSFYGFALASSTDSLDALNLAKQTSVQNLRFEIDRHTENTRTLLAENSSEYNTPEFITRLRNAVRVLSLENSEVIHQYDTADERIFYVYMRASMPADSLTSIINTHISDKFFLDELGK